VPGVTFFTVSNKKKTVEKKKLSKPPWAKKNIKKPKHKKVEKKKFIALGKIIFLSGKKVTLRARGHFFYRLRQKKTVQKKLSKPRWAKKKILKPKHKKVEKKKFIALGKIIFLSGEKVTLRARGHFFYRLQQKKTVQKKLSKPPWAARPKKNISRKKIYFSKKKYWTWRKKNKVFWKKPKYRIPRVRLHLGASPPLLTFLYRRTI
jgi:hypothetical protein